MNEEILGNAFIFYHACRILIKKMNEGVLALSSGNLDAQNRQNGKLVVPIIVNASFACELFLKSVLPDGTHGHALNELFTCLDQKGQDEIIEYTKSAMKRSNSNYTKEQFLKDLNDSSRYFVSWRYFHEGHGLDANLQFIVNFLDALAQMASKRKSQKDLAQ